MNPIKVGRWWILEEDTDMVARSARDSGEIAVQYVNAVLRQLRPGNGDWAVDVGAYVGDTAVVLRERGWRVLAIEARRDAFECLQRNCPDVLCICEAAGDGRTFWREDDGPETAGGARFLRPQPAGERRTLALDEVGIPNCGLLKIDVEGFEPLVIAGALRLLQRFKPVVLTEVNPLALSRIGLAPGDVLDPLRSAGYHCRRVVAGTSGEPEDWLCWPVQ